VVITENDRPVGIFTERDLLKRVVGEKRDPEATSVGDVMTEKVACCTPDTPIAEVRAIMRDRKVRHVPVVDGDQCLRGMVSIGDLNSWDLDQQGVEIHYLHEYLQGNSASASVPGT
jgi:CBS domain-containing protein